MENINHRPYLARWQECASALNVPADRYNQLELRQFTLPSGYSFIGVYNPSRQQRPGISKPMNGCNMCKVIQEIKQIPKVNLDSEGNLPDYGVSLNIFPPTEGATLLISPDHSPMYSSQNLSGLGSKGEKLANLLSYAKRYDLRIFHQTLGAGATIDAHEHWHGTTMHHLQQRLGVKSGFDAAELKPVSGASHAYTMPQFPFAHMVFDPSDPEKIVHFLSRLSQKLPSPLPDGSIPHTFSQGEQGILIAPLRVDVQRSMGSEMAPGYFYAKTLEEFDALTPEKIVDFMAERFFDKSVDLATLL